MLPKTDQKGQIEVEQALIDHMEILTTMNQKLNSHVHSVKELKDYVNQRLSKVESVTINKDIETIPARYDIMQLDNTIKKLVNDLESVRND